MIDASFDYPVFGHPSFLRQHIFDIVAFYWPRCIDYRNGGYFNSFLDDGTVSDYETKHLVGISRFIFIFSTACRIGGPVEYRAAAEHGLRFLQEVHRDREHGGYFWILKGRRPEDRTKHAYGHAFALLAASTAYMAGIAWAESVIREIYDLLESRFWREDDGLYADEISPDWSTVSPYRGQNANMHICEAMMAAYEATGDRRYLDRASLVAYNVMFKLLPQSGSLIWEHYNEKWKIDWNYNKGNNKNEFRPYGYIFGHSIEWCKLLLLLDRFHPEPWHLPYAERLFDEAVDKGFDRTYGGLYYSMSPENGAIIDTDKVYWVMAEAIGASALLTSRTGQLRYRSFYDNMFAYCRCYLIDNARGGWYQLLDRFNRRYSNIKSPPPKADYHPVTNCMTSLIAFGSHTFRQQDL